MDTSEIFRIIQKYTEANPLFFVGSGTSAAYGLPGMGKLGEHLLESLSSKYASDSDWQHFEDNIKSGKDLESAMTDIVFKEEIIDDNMINEEIETEDGEVDLKIVDELTRDGKNYALLVVLDDNGEETDEAAVFELTKDEEGYDVIESIDDEWLLDELYEEFGVGVEDEE